MNRFAICAERRCYAQVRSTEHQHKNLVCTYIAGPAPNRMSEPLLNQLGRIYIEYPARMRTHCVGGLPARPVRPVVRAEPLHPPATLTEGGDRTDDDAGSRTQPRSPALKTNDGAGRKPEMRLMTTGCGELSQEHGRRRLPLGSLLVVQRADPTAEGPGIYAESTFRWRI